VKVDPDSHGLPKKVTVEPTTPAGAGPLTLVKDYVRNDIGQVLEETTTGNVTAVHPVSGEWAAVSQARKRFIVYDMFGYPREVKNALGQTEEMIFEPELGVLAAHRDANGIVTTYRYDGFGRLRGQVNPYGADLSVKYLASSTGAIAVETVRERVEGDKPRQELSRVRAFTTCSARSRCRRRPRRAGASRSRTSATMPWDA
jgi:YD repeat-containing protein